MTTMKQNDDDGDDAALVAVHSYRLVAAATTELRVL